MKSLLVVENSETDLLLLERDLRQAGIRNPLCVLKSGEAALEWLREGGPENTELVLGLLDIDLGGEVDGFGVLRELRNHPRTATLPVAIMTTSQRDSDLLDSYSLNAQGFLPKPVAATDLFSLLRAIDSVGVEIV